MYRGIVGPICFQDTINAARQTDILESFLELLSEQEIHEEWFQQDGATAHTARRSLRFLEDIFADENIFLSKILAHQITCHMGML